ncbi:IS5/IS1182 family transposase [Blastopirellula marina]|uniref:IS5/IS1182 family transposase n=2 Tax=Pirellulales TaxID=2691354 RepID=A0A2S8G376_9BACT|nr:IS5/IS1182 family transposase [Blastopirellula marina]RCS55181.1 IS5 family transposase [Bremerella cremea]
MGRSVYGRQLCSGKKGGHDVGKTKRGKGTKWMVVADGQGVPLACSVHSASKAEVRLAEETLQKAKFPEKPTPVVADKAYDSDKLRDELAEQNWELVCPHRKNRKRKPRQDGRKLRRYRRRWIVERTISWIGNFRRLVVRYEHHSWIYQAFMHVACGLICLRRF